MWKYTCIDDRNNNIIIASEYIQQDAWTYIFHQEA